MKKKIIIIIAVLLLIGVETFIITLAYKREEVNTKIPSDYIIVFKGESGVTVHTTYIYKEKKKKKTKYKYINTITEYTGTDSSQVEEKIIKKGEIKKLKKSLEIAKKNHADSYVKYEDGKIYTIEGYKEKFQ